MIRVLFDTNVVLDLLAKRERVMDAAMAYDVALNLEAEPCIAATATTDIFYLLSSKHFLGDSKSAAHTMEALLDLFDLIDTRADDCHRALASEMTDYEDAVLAWSAKREEVDYLITNDKEHFVASPVPALTPAEFISIFKPIDTEYAESDL